jgi:hypothetical protein
MVELGEDLNPVLQPDSISPFNLSALSVSTGTNPLPSSEPLVNTIDDFSIPNVPQSVDLSDFISGGGTGATDPYSAVINIANTPNSESDIAIYTAKPYTFASGYKQTNFNRYYNDKDNFYKLGFSPIANNEEIYNSNRSWYEDLGRAASGVPGLGLSFLKSIYGANIGDEYAEANALYGSTKGGVAGFTSNLVLNTAPFLAIGVDWYLTNTALAALGTIPGLQGLAGAGVALKTASTIDKFKDLITIFSSAQKMREAFTFANTARNIGNVLYKVTPYAETGKAIFETAKAVGQGEKLINAARTAKNIGTFIRDTKQLSYAMGEANLEGDMARNDFIDARINEFIKENGYYPSEDELDNIYETGEDVKFTTSMFNMPILYLSNAIVFDNLYKGSSKSLFRPANQYVKNFTKSGVSVVIEDGTAKVVSGLKENLKFAAKGLVQPQRYGKFAVNYFGANLAEGLQEVAQEAIAGASQDYYKELYNTNEAGGIAMYMGSFYDNLKKQMSAQGAEVFLSGFLLGGLASVGGSAIGGATDIFTNQYNKNFRKDYNDLYKSDSTAAKEIADNINLAMSDGYKIFTPDIENLLVQMRLGQDMTEAKLNYDEKAFHDLKDAARFNAIYTVLQTGNFNNLINKLENMKESTGSELKEAFDIEESVTEEEAKKILDVTIQRAKQIQNQYEQVSDIQNPFNPSRYKKSEITNDEIKRQYETEIQGYYGFEDARKQAVFNAHAAGQASKRMSDLVSNLSSIADIGKLSFTDIKNILDIDSLNEELDTLEMELSNLSETTDPKLKQIKKAKESKRKALQTFRKEFQKIQDLEDASAIEKRKALKNAFSKYVTKLAEESNLTIPSNKLDEAFAMLSDYYALSKDLRRYNTNVAAMADPQIFYNQVARNINVRKELITNIGNISKELLDKFLNNKKSQDLINELHDLGFVISVESIPMLDGTYEQLYDYLSTDPDVKFIDLKSGVVFGVDDPRYQDIKDTIQVYNEEVKKKEEVKPEETETETETEEQPEEDKIPTEDGVPLIQSLNQFNTLPLKLQGLLRSSLSQQNINREADGEPELPLDRFLRTATSRRIISKYFKDPENAADIKAYNEKKAPAKPAKATKAEPITPTQPITTDAKADIEEERKRELKRYDERDASSLEAITPNNPNHPTIKVGMKYNLNLNLNVIVEKTNTDNWNGEGEGYSIITAVISPAEFGEDGKMTKAAKINVAIFNSKEEAEAAVYATFEKVKSRVGQKQKEINAKYDTQLARELYKEMKAGKLVTDMTPAEQEVVNKYVTEELRKSVDAELAGVEQGEVSDLKPFLDKIKDSKTIQDLIDIENEFSETDFIEELDNINIMREAIALKKQELTQSIKYENIKPKDVLVLGDNKYGLVEKVTSTKLTVVPLYGERMTPAKDANKRITILKKNFSKMVKSVYDTQANIEIGVKNVPAPSTEEKELITKNADLQINFLTDKDAKEAARLEATNQSADDINDEFLNGLGC